DSPLRDFTGRYVVRGKGHFVEPDLPRFNKLLFIPPSQRKKAREGDYILCKVTQHPFKDGKSQVSIIEKIGSPDQIGIEANYTLRKFKLPTDWSQDFEFAADSRSEQRKDLTSTPFVTIDSADTQDVDDAVWAEANEHGWMLQVAVADPGAFIPSGSPLDNAARTRATSIYLPGKVLAMLPTALSHDKCSLLANVNRPALVCSMQVSPDGDISDIAFSEATIHSSAKLSYDDVAQHLSGDSALPHDCLKPLHAVSQALRSLRQRQQLVMPEQADIRYQLNDQQKIGEISKVERNDAHRLIEECMLAANRSAASWLQGNPSLYSCHAGLREERLGNVAEVIAAELPALKDADITSLEGYTQLIQASESSESSLPLRSIFARMLQRGELSSTPKPHYGLGLSSYCTFTSPLRKYGDLIVQRSIRAKLGDEEFSAPTEETVAALQDAQRNARGVSNQVEKWLQFQYMQTQPKDHIYSGKISHLNGGGFTVELDDTGISGFVEARSFGEKMSFDANTLRFFNTNKHCQLEQQVHVKCMQIDPYKQQLIFKLEETSTAES
ncbi:MAG: VacB/RNase II family 3'-5' exoribonuclease, partial [Spongiibacteraceae bacterium]